MNGSDRHQGLANRTGNGANWPQWAPVGVVVLGVVSLPLIVLNPLLAILTAVIAAVTGWVGMSEHHGSDRSFYLIGLALGVLTLVLLAVAALGLYSTSSSAPQPSPPQPAQAP